MHSIWSYLRMRLAITWIASLKGMTAIAEPLDLSAFLCYSALITQLFGILFAV